MWKPFVCPNRPKRADRERLLGGRGPSTQEQRSEIVFKVLDFTTKCISRFRAPALRQGRYDVRVRNALDAHGRIDAQASWPQPNLLSPQPYHGNADAAGAASWAGIDKPYSIGQTDFGGSTRPFDQVTCSIAEREQPHSGQGAMALGKVLACDGIRTSLLSAPKANNIRSFGLFFFTLIMQEFPRTASHSRA